MPFFNLQEGEKIVKEIKPLPSLRNYFLFGGIIIFIAFGLVFLFLLFISLTLWLIFMFFDFLILIAALIFSSMRYKHQYYWITNKRVIYKRGLIGYRISSIPLERISDIILSRSFIERLFGFGSLHVQTLAGQITYGRYLGAEASLLAVPDPEETQELIFQLVKKKRKEEKITF